MVGFFFGGGFGKEGIRMWEIEIGGLGCCDREREESQGENVVVVFFASW